VATPSNGAARSLNSDESAHCEAEL
jgi:hypothetical protein